MNLLKLTLQQASECSGESLSVLHDAIRAGDLKSFVVGRRRFIRPEALKRWVDFLEKQSDKGAPVKYRAADPSERRARQ